MSTTPIFTQSEAQARQTFLELMWALSHPGRAQMLPDAVASAPDNFIAIGETLLDLETTFFTPDAALAQALSRTTARTVEADVAAYHVYPAFTPSTLDQMASAPVGDMLYPDRAATLILGCQLGGADSKITQSSIRLTLSGPGIQTEQTLHVQGIPAEFWSLRQSKLSYPLGWDVFLVDGTTVVGLPRTTAIEPTY